MPMRVELQGLPIFRHPKAFGRPSISYLKPRTAIIPFPRFSEIQFLSFRKACLIIECPRPENTGRSITYKLQDIAKALRKSQNLRSLRLQFSNWLQYLTKEAVEQAYQESDGFKPGIWAITQAAHSIGCELIVERHPECLLEGESQDDDPIIPWLLHAAFLEGIFIERTPDPQPSETGDDHDTSDWEQVEPKQSKTEGSADSDDEDEEEPKLIHGMHPEDLERWYDPDPRPYRKVPECHVCYALFAYDSDLDAHLEAKPSHDRRFRHKRRNELGPGACRDGVRECRACQRGFKSLEESEKHFKKTGHIREDLVSMWEEDSKWWKELCLEAQASGRYGLIGAKVA